MAITRSGGPGPNVTSRVVEVTGRVREPAPTLSHSTAGSRARRKEAAERWTRATHGRVHVSNGDGDGHDRYDRWR